MSKRRSGSVSVLSRVAVCSALLTLLAGWAGAQGAPTDSFGLKIFRVESGLYPFVQVYFRTFNQDMRPLVNLNEMNMGVMVKGKSYDPMKRQYRVQSIANRGEAIRSVLVIDCSKTMAGEPFRSALRAAARFIDSKRPQDQVALLAIRDTDQGFEVVSDFERDSAALGRRLADVKCDGNKTRLYDAIAGAMQMCGMVSQGGTQSNDAEYIISNSIVVISDGKDEGSALTREELNTRISNLGIPIPIYSLAYSRVDPSHLRNLEALSKNSFGIFYNIGESYDRMQSTVEDIYNILKNDYVLVFRSYVPVDGETHALKVGLEYPSRSGRMTYQSAEFEAIEPPPVDRVRQAQAQCNQMIPALPDANPYLSGAIEGGVPSQPAPAGAAVAPHAGATGGAAAALEAAQQGQ
jgi:hypothetical protein